MGRGVRLMDYSEFLKRKTVCDPMTGIATPPALPDVMFPHQRDIANWALRRGRAAIFAGTGLGKTIMELVWADKVAEHTGKPALIFAPLAVARQHVREAEKFGLGDNMAFSDGGEIYRLSTTNYHKMDKFDLSQFGGIVLDESSILKNETGKYRNELVKRCADIPFRLAATATPAPNDYMELGNHAEFLGVMSYTDMLATFFTHDGGETQKWRLKGHAENVFWEWVSSWAVMLQKPSDLGYDDAGYDLPPLNQFQHTVKIDDRPSVDTGMLFRLEARTMQERHEARRDSVEERCYLASTVALSNICIKLAEDIFSDRGKLCLGSLNTQKIGSERLSLILNTLKGAGPKESPKTPMHEKNTCETITTKTSTSGSIAPPKSNSNIAKLGGKGTHPIQNTQNLDARKSGETRGSIENTELASRTMTDYLQIRADAAQFVGQKRETGPEGGLPSITVTKREQLEGFCALIATWDLESLKTVYQGLIEQSNTSLKPERWVVWCHLNKEQDELKRLFGDMCVSISGADNDEQKMQKHQDWVDEVCPILLVKPSMFGHGLNWQFCSNCIFVGLSDSFEQVYQAIRRFWRFGQTKPVNVHFIAAETEGAVVQNIKRKEADAERMAKAMVMHTKDLNRRAVRGMVREKGNYNPTLGVKVPDFVKSDEWA